MQVPSSNPSSPPRVNILGVGVSAINMEMALARITQALEERRKGYVCVTGVHGLSEAQADPGFGRILNRAFLCTPDGMPLVWVGRLLGRKQMSRVYGPDLMLAVMALSGQKGWRHFFYGGSGGTALALREKLVGRFPRLQVVGVYEPPFRPLLPAEQAHVGEMIRLARPDAVWVGLSTPKQERFMAEFLPQWEATLMFGVGAAFDFLSGRVRQAPRWMQRSGLEWFFRLCSEPGRLGKRYGRNNPLFVTRIFCQFTGLKKYPIKD